MPILIRHDFNLSAFIVAGDQFVNALQTSSPILVRPHSSGYDGQFYYALAIDPFHAGTAFHGVVIDHPSYRAQRIFYPLVVFAAALGQASFVPAAMVAINLVSLFVLAFLVRRTLPRLPSFAIVLWPGLLTTLTHDSTEILACTLLFGALVAYLDGRIVLFAALAAMATLTRETSSLYLAGIALAGILHHFRHRRSLLDLRDARPAIAAAVALIPLLLWRLYLMAEWRGTSEHIPLQANMGWPFVGLATRLTVIMSSLVAAHGVSVKMRLMDIYVLGAIVLIIAFCILTARSAKTVWRRGGHPAGLALGWGFTILLMSLLSARGAWVEPTAFFRVFSEAWLVGWLLVSLDHARRLAWTIPVLLPLAAVNYVVCIIQLRGGVLHPH